MGPRSFERGKGLPVQLDCGRDVTSMGPRSFERGKGDAGVECPICHRTSMGPRSFERGKTVTQGGIRSATPDFNGAAFV